MTQPILAELTQKNEALCWGGEISRSGSRITSGIASLDRLLGGGLRFGEISEWGMPPGCSGRSVILHFLAQLCRREQTPLMMWVYGDGELTVYPPAWEAKGIDLRMLYFVRSDHPVAQLRPVFLDALFRVLVLDAPKRLSADDQAFVAHHARRHQQAVLLLRPYFLSSKRGNIWARQRLNCWFDAARRCYVIRAVRGTSQGLVRLERLS